MTKKRKNQKQATDLVSPLGIIDQFASLNISGPTDYHRQGHAQQPSIYQRWQDYFQKGSLEDWQRLCCDLNLPKMSSKSQCRKAISHVFVNIRQFLEAKNKPEDVLFFRNVYDLSEYTKDKHMFFPRRQLEKGSPLRQLLKQIH